MASGKSKPSDDDGFDPSKLIEAASARIQKSMVGARARVPWARGGLEAAFGEVAELTHAERLASNPPDAIRRRLRRRGHDAADAESVARSPEFEVLRDEAPVTGLERIIGKDMLMEINYLDGGRLTAQAVARVVIRGPSGQVRGYGTGFLVSPRLLLTNNHVLGSVDAAAASTIEFNYQRDLAGKLPSPTVFHLDPEALFVTSPAEDLDFTLVAVKESSETGGTTREFGFKPLVAVADEILAGECVTIIQHPSGVPKQIALRENEVLYLPGNGDSFLHYQTDTHPGSSGSPVFNDGWEVVALHHSGKPKTNAEGKILARDGRVWEPSMGQDAIDWVANEGIRVAAIVRFLHEKEATMTAAQKALLAAALSEAGPTETVPPQPVVPCRPAVPKRSTPQSTTATQDGVASSPEGSTTVVVPLHITVKLGQGALLPSGSVAAERLGDEAVTIDQDYEDRSGYDESFLGTGSQLVTMPKITADQRRYVAINRRAIAGDPNYLLRYHHFSVVMNARRRLPFFTAVNIDGAKHYRDELDRERDKWFYDPRISRDAQIGNELYARNPFDRGHLVRRLDPAWGDDYGVAKTANDDTFHFTNCSPQHERFNQGKNLWAGLEDFLLGKAAAESRRLSVFTGPVFRRDDPVYRDVRIPRDYWKVAVLVKPNGNLSATGYVVTQAELVDDTIAVEEISAAAVARLFQVGVAAVEELTDLDFGALREHEPAGQLEIFREAEGRVELEGYGDIVL